MGLNKEQGEAVLHVNGPCLVLAGPGSGKTFTLVERIRYLIENEDIIPSRILVITFSKKAALEMQARFNKLIGDKFYPVTFGTFHAVFFNILKQYYNYKLDSILSEQNKTEYLKNICEKLDIKEAHDDNYILDTLKRISFYKSLSDEDKIKFKGLKLTNEEKEKFVSIFDAYVYVCRREGKIDFDDMLYLCRDLLADNKDILLEWQCLYKYFLIDEFQDINDIQYEVLDMLSGSEKNVFAVGDDDQSIYGFRGSKPELMRKFIVDNNAKVINLSKNYRCSEVVIDYAGELINVNKERINKFQTAEKTNKEDGFVKINTFMNQSEEALFICDEIKKYINYGGKYSDIAILFRTTQCISLLEEKLLLKGIPYECGVKKTGFYENEHVLNILTYLKIANGSMLRSDFFRILNKPFRGLLRDEIYDSPLKEDNLSKYYMDYKEQNIAFTELLSHIKYIKEMSCFEAVNYIFKVVGYGSFMRVELMKKGFSFETIKELQAEILERSKEFYGIEEWITYSEELRTAKIEGSDNGKKIDRVILQTAHASKGLEYETVFIAGLQEGIFPHNKAVTESDIEEERRLLYVAMTRAKKYLYICGVGDNENGKRVSRFINEVQNSGKIKGNGV